MGRLQRSHAARPSPSSHRGRRARHRIADIDGDGKPDILTPFGWIRQINADADQWEWHPDWNLRDTGFPIIGYDVNNDGRMDLIVGQGHSYGLYWWEQGGPKSHPKWTKHIIDESFS